MRPVSCKRCMTVVDLDNAPLKTTDVPARGESKSFVQDDVMCPTCGGLLYRAINGVVVTSDGRDPREPPPPPPPPPSELGTNPEDNPEDSPDPEK